MKHQTTTYTTRKHRQKDVDVRIQKSGEDYDLNQIIHGVVKPVGIYKLSNAKTEAKGIINDNPDAENIERHTAY